MAGHGLSAVLNGAAANNLEFEKAALLRDQIKELKGHFGQMCPRKGDFDVRVGVKVLRQRPTTGQGFPRWTSFGGSLAA